MLHRVAATFNGDVCKLCALIKPDCKKSAYFSIHQSVIVCVTHLNCVPASIKFSSVYGLYAGVIQNIYSNRVKSTGLIQLVWIHIIVHAYAWVSTDNIMYRFEFRVQSVSSLCKIIFVVYIIMYFVVRC